MTTESDRARAHRLDLLALPIGHDLAALPAQAGPPANPLEALAELALAPRPAWVPATAADVDGRTPVQRLHATLAGELADPWGPNIAHPVADLEAAAAAGDVPAWIAVDAADVLARRTR